jgi:hypothetical protein
MTEAVNKVSVKYKTKNNITEGNKVFLTTINQISANTNSMRNFRLIATRVCKVWLSGSLYCPRMKIKTVIRAITEKESDKIIISVYKIIFLVVVTNIPPAEISRTFNNKI